MHKPNSYEKGVYVYICETGEIVISGLMILHPSNMITGFGVDTGWYYEKNEGNWKKLNQKKQCQCLNKTRHELHFSLLNILNQALKDNEFKKESDLCYRHIHV